MLKHLFEALIQVGGVSVFVVILLAIGYAQHGGSIFDDEDLF